MSFSRLQWSSCWVGQSVLKSFPAKSFILVALQWQQPTVRVAKLICWRVFEQHTDFLRAPRLPLCSCPWPLTSVWRTATEKREGSSIRMIFPGFLLAQSLNRSLGCGKLLAGTSWWPVSCSFSALYKLDEVFGHHCSWLWPKYPTAAPVGFKMWWGPRWK